MEMTTTVMIAVQAANYAAAAARLLDHTCDALRQMSPHARCSLFYHHRRRHHH